MPEELRQRPLYFSTYSDKWESPIYEKHSNTEKRSDIDQIMVVLPEKRFAICLISTHGSPSSWRLVLSKLYANNTSMTIDLENTHNIAEENTPPRPTAAELQSVFSDPGATRVALTREPLDRFRSAFFDKCNKDSVTDECPILPLGSDGRNLTMKDAVEWMLTQDPTKLETHWLLQSEHCELRERLAKYTVIARYSYDRMSEDNDCIMRMAGLSEFNNMGVGFASAPFWDAVVDPDPAGGVHTELQAARLLQKLFTQDAARQLIQHLRVDYETFNYPQEPDWLEGATGELYRQHIRLLE